MDPANGHSRALKTGMLKITLMDAADELRFRLEGKLSGAWVAELRQSWTTAASIIGERRTIVDLGEVDFVDDDGQQLLVEMTRAGVKIHAVTPLMLSVAQETERNARKRAFTSASPNPA